MKDKAQNLLRKYPLAAGGVALLLTICITLFLRKDQLETLQTGIQDVRADVLRMTRNLNNADNLEAQVEAMENLAASVPNRLLRAEDTAFNANYFYGFERETNVRITTFNVGNVPADGEENPWRLQQFQRVYFNLTAVGHVDSLMHLLHAIQTGPRLARVTRIAFLREGGVRARERTLSLTIEALAEKPEERK